MGFVRVCGYGQSDLDNKYQEGYDDGYDDGATDVTSNPCMILAKYSDDETHTTIINADREDDLDIHILNNTAHNLMIILNGSMSGANQSVTISVNGEVVETIDWLIARTITFPVGGDLHFYQDKVGGTENEEGSIFLTITGKRSNDSFTNNIIWTDSEDKTEGTATFSTVLS